MAKKKKPSAAEEFDLREKIKKLVIIAMFSDDELMDRFVLKGGNALDLIHHVSTRASVDIDLSIADDFTPDERLALQGRMEKALPRHVSSGRFPSFRRHFSGTAAGLDGRRGGFLGRVQSRIQAHLARSLRGVERRTSKRLERMPCNSAKGLNSRSKLASTNSWPGRCAKTSTDSSFSFTRPR